MKIKIGLDLGASNIKMVTYKENKEDKKFYFEKKIIPSLVTNSGIDNKYLVKSDESSVYFGVGESLALLDKTERPYFLETVALAIKELYEESDEVFNVELGIGLPLNLYKSNKKEDFEKEINSKYGKNKLNSFIVGDKNIEFKLSNIKVYAEGYSAYYALADKITSPSFVLVDIGYKTTDIIGVSIQSEKNAIVDGYLTINKGMLEVYTEMCKEFLDIEKTAFIPKKLEQRLLYIPSIKIKEKTIEKTIDLNDYIKYGKIVVDDIINQISLKFTDINIREMILVGGGATIVNKILKEKNNLNLNILDKDESLYANATGFFLQLL